MQWRTMEKEKEGNTPEDIYDVCSAGRGWYVFLSFKFLFRYLITNIFL